MSSSGCVQSTLLQWERILPMSLSGCVHAGGRRTHMQGFRFVCTAAGLMWDYMYKNFLLKSRMFITGRFITGRSIKQDVRLRFEFCDDSGVTDISGAEPCWSQPGPLGLPPIRHICQSQTFLRGSLGCNHQTKTELCDWQEPIPSRSPVEKCCHLIQLFFFLNVAFQQGSLLISLFGRYVSHSFIT